MHPKGSEFFLGLTLSIIDADVVLELFDQGIKSVGPCGHHIEIGIEKVWFKPFSGRTAEIGESICNLSLIGKMIRAVKENQEK